MSKPKLTKDQIIAGLVKPLVTLLALGLSFIEDKETLDEVVNETAAQINALKDQVAEPPTFEQGIDAVLEIADTIAEFTPTEVDDAIVDGVQALVGSKGFNLIEVIKAFIKIKKKQKAEG
jgi:hypothetical protein